MRVAQQLTDSFYSSFIRVLPWKKKVWKEARERHQPGVTPPYVTTILGRKRRLPDLLAFRDGDRLSAERQAVSVVISGSSADLFKVIMINCHNELLRQPWEGHILMTVHDEIVVEAPAEYKQEAYDLVKRTMENVLNPFTGEPMVSVPLIAEAKIVTRWSEAK